MRPANDLLNKTAKTNATLAAELHARWRAAEPKLRQRPAQKSLATYVGNLRKGDTAWWSARPVVTRLLAEIAGTTPEALLAPPIMIDESVRVADFHDLPPVRPYERLADLAPEGSLADLVEHEADHPRPVWILAPVGAGKRLVIRHLRLRRPELVCVEARTLIDAARDPRLVPDRPAIISVIRTDASDPIAEEELRERPTATVVLAAFAPPSTAWPARRWAPDDGWLRQLARWILARSENARFDADVAVQFLDDVDPGGDGVATPGDAVPLLAWATRGGRSPAEVSEIPVGEIADALVRERLVAVGADQWIRDAGAALLRSAALAALTRGVEGRPTRGISEWADAIDTTTLIAARSRAVTSANALDLDTRLVATAALVEAGLLVEAEFGFAIYPRWLRYEYERAGVATVAARGDWNQLGRWAAAPHARPLVVAALRAESQPKLIALTRTLVGAASRGLAWAAAVEATFEAVAYNLTPEASDLPGWKLSASDKRTLRDLGDLQVQLAALSGRARSSAEPMRLTAPPALHGEPDNAEWLALAWGFSLAVPAPTIVPEVVGWAFAGWGKLPETRVFLLTIQSNKVGLGPEYVPRASYAFGLLARVGIRVLERNPSLLTDDAPDVIHAAAVLSGIPTPRRGRGNVVYSVHEARVIADIAATMRAPTQRTIAVAVWRSLRLADPHDPVELLRHAGPLSGLLADALPVVAFLEAMDADAVLRAMHLRHQNLDTLPDRLLVPLLVTLTPTLQRFADSAFLSLESAVSRVTDVEALVPLLVVRGDCGRAAAVRIWTLAPELALAQLGERLHTDPESAANLIQASPAELAETVVSRALSGPDVFTYFAPRWLAERVAEGNAASYLLFDVLVERIGATLQPTTPR
ncbi:MAG: hypothetical protein AB7S26_30695 [Sandaracinaceae bacterium]